MADEIEIAQLTGLRPLSARYDLLLCDIWGVVHNGVAAFAAASDALSRFRQRGGTVVLVSNAPRPAESILPQLDGLGVPRAAYDSVVTSGDGTRAALVERAREAVHHIGPERDLPLFAGLPLRFAPLDDAAAVVCTGLLDDQRETAEDYRERLELMRSRGLPMICANPDLVVERGDRLVPCAGAVAALYEEMGGAVIYTGKPHRPIYEASLERAAAIAGKPIDPARVLAIGDAIRTDIAGAAAFGIDAILIAGGIHAAELGLAGGLDGKHVRRWLAAQGARPIGVMDKLTW